MVVVCRRSLWLFVVRCCSAVVRCVGLLCVAGTCLLPVAAVVCCLLLLVDGCGCGLWLCVVC